MEYYERAKASTAATGSKAAGPSTVANSTQRTTPAFMTLPEQYGLKDMFFANSSIVDTQTFEQEYQLYMSAPVSPRGTNILEF
jgi:hypothetical protein